MADRRLGDEEVVLPSLRECVEACEGFCAGMARRLRQEMEKQRRTPALRTTHYPSPSPPTDARPPLLRSLTDDFSYSPSRLPRLLLLGWLLPACPICSGRGWLIKEGQPQRACAACRGEGKRLLYADIQASPFEAELARRCLLRMEEKVGLLDAQLKRRLRQR